MSRKQKFNFFHLFKGGKSDELKTPLHGAPNTNLDTYDKRNGRFKSRRKFGKDGDAYVDLDTGHKHGAHYDHAHDIDVSKEKPRSNNHRDLTRKEKRELKKAKRKRRFWK